MLVLAAAGHLKNSGVDAFVLCANTMHLFAKEVEDAYQLPVIHIAEATGLEIKKQKVKKVGLLGTKFTMEKEFFKSKY